MKKFDLQRDIRIDRYIDGLMNNEEFIHFLMEMDQDDELKEDVEFRKKLKVFGRLKKSRDAGKDEGGGFRPKTSSDHMGKNKLSPGDSESNDGKSDK